MKRILNFILGLWIFVVVGTFLFLFIDNKSISSYQEKLQQYTWFTPAIYWAAGLLLALSLILIIWSFTPSHKARGLLLNYPDGEVHISKKSIEKTVLHTVQKYNGVRQPSANVKLFKKKNTSYIDVSVDLFITKTDNIQTYLSTIREDIKASTEHFSELAVREVKLNLLDQKSLKKRVL